ncbi:DUF1007 family protein [Stagnihabitans tardus]|uniref:DUF1007 family protein n=1 Tax=Stagnihabitans tardus TaxID=2699202 RepID=A0AAE4YFW0_9RHOB|nr:DUF1007 family protein [Stagnihabitans tardus]NBZ89170.1 DUF1007 family protein [Stagnihabitans tardus]
MSVKALLLAACLAPSVAEAHPHVFLDTMLVLTFDDSQRLASIRVAWAYDEYFSMSVFADMGLDSDLDGKLTEAEVEQLQGFNTDWPPGYVGHLYVEAAGVDQPLSGPLDASIRVEEGRILSFISRDLVQPVKIGPGGLTIRNYDPYYYNEFTLTALPMMKNAPPGCSARIEEPDLSAADQALKAELQKIPAGESIEGDYPQVGRLYAQTLRITCEGA